MLTYHEIAIRLILSTILGGIIGIERERRNQPAGLRTHIILCVGSTLMMLVSIYVASEIGNPQNSDPARIAAQVVSGVGFLGAGAILRFGVSIKGLTTAASLWTTAGIGLGAGAGFYVGSLLATIIIIIALTLLSKWEKVFLASKGTKSINLVAKDVPDIIGKVEKVLNKHGIAITTIQVYRNVIRDSLDIIATVTTIPGLNISALSNDLTSYGEVSEVEIQ
ncbi:MAG: MgtC/SapB family protein [Nitrospinae bacterium]|nr:MgtC/SapB family protein [Nitrospinota bacterium]